MSEVAFDDPRKAVLAVEAKVRGLCVEQGADVAEGIMLLLTAAAHMSQTYGTGSTEARLLKLADCLGHAFGAGEDFFRLRSADDGDD